MAGHLVAANPRERSSDVVDRESAREAARRLSDAIDRMAEDQKRAAGSLSRRSPLEAGRPEDPRASAERRQLALLAEEARMFREYLASSEAESRRNFALSVLADVLAALSLAVALASWLVG